MNMMDKLKGLVGKSPDQAEPGRGQAASVAEEKTGDSDSDSNDEAGEQARGSGERQSEQDGQEPGGHGGEQRQ